ncbi:MAG: Crp/Fnr family transcriptional regulator [Armatimonadota bacterium]|nr:Crp/Fnr family transcriptional regulator [Armatimonadota bacterium]MDR7450054.1 Crp/Fnr family transcriptional regulator [Armatimonadota bacterium]MDR7458970.1 Crp/Fnr family transcriptional regulator [Armatimonadota bacterium]MDR7478884.1 Crp/Fnr family transcriptional regulator [Armatimonadota bacterium]MDR7488274.1 Crp/Fnr family transcriptional regulator [Armatimonadota bacterium]
MTGIGYLGVEGCPSGPLQGGWAIPPLKDKAWYLRGAFVFRDLPEAEMRRLAERASMRTYARGRVILQPGEQSAMVFLIKEGRVKLSTTSPEGREQILALLEPGDLFGERALLGERHPLQAEAFEDTVVCGVPKEDLEQLLRSNSEIALRLIRVLAERLRLAEEEIENLVFRDVPGRLAAVLLRLGEEYGVREDSLIRLTLRLTHQDLANMVGATRETVTTILSRFRGERLIDVDRRQIVIRDPEGLRRLMRRGEPVRDPPAARGQWPGAAGARPSGA